jgi:hypothetical protein
MSLTTRKSAFSILARTASSVVREMRIPIVGSVIAVVVLMVVGVAVSANQFPDSELLVGVWRVDEITLVRPAGGGTNTEPQPGLFIFTRDHYSIAWIPRPEPRSTFTTPWTPTAEEKERAYGTILFNSGTYQLSDTTVTTRPILSKVPDLSGGHAVYEYRIEDDVLWLTMVDEYAADGSRAPWVGNVSFPLKLTRIE